MKYIIRKLGLHLCPHCKNELQLMGNGAAVCIVCKYEEG